tara:strand:+ start:429 stop:644 length:216 start_codon:yes stop_codon:yes gene_type:complete
MTYNHTRGLFEASMCEVYAGDDGDFAIGEGKLPDGALQKLCEALGGQRVSVYKDYGTFTLVLEDIDLDYDF